MAAALPNGSYYSVKEVAAHFRVSYMTIIRMIERAELPAVRIGNPKRGAYRIPAVAVHSLTAPAAEIPAQRSE